MYLSLLLLALAAQAPLLWQMLQAWQGTELQRLAALNAVALHLGAALTVAAVFGRLRWCLPLLALAALLGPAEAFYFNRFGLPSGAHVYGVIAETTWDETHALLGAWLAPLGVVSLLFLALVALACRTVWLADLRWQHRSRWWVLTAAGLLGAFVAFGQRLVFAATGASDIDTTTESQHYLEHRMTGAHTGLLAELETTFPWGMPIRAQRYFEHRNALALHLGRSQDFRFDVRWVRPAQATPQVHVLVIGETARADRWSLFGYGRDTTPLLVRRDRAAEVATFHDTASASSATRESVPLMLTRRHGFEPLKPMGEPSVLTAFSQAGFKTYWLSAQGTAGIHETPVSVLAHEADHQHFINQVDYRGRGALDGELLPLLANAMQDPAPRKFIVLHTLGSHLNYAHRYPAEFERFKPALQASDKPDVWGGPQERLLNAYDNSVLYTDHVLEQVIRLVEKAGVQATVTYAADHGESLFDGRCKQAGHGFAAIANYHIPMFVWASHAWRDAQPDTWQQLRARQHSPVTTLAMFPTLTHLAGFEAGFEHGPKALGARDWAPFPRVVTHFGDYDGSFRKLACDAPADTTKPARPARP
ncbi:phosphoethanolamine transferase [Pelomonas sp. UHG3]|uniref:Phosphoethanolamine transferase n=1 Tax=Roseateles hydrophilus TaxID=2975054 RepID=A0ACC6C954_9BURK|nr:phosphoethanolamine transferase [Pelomonas sp. UHG3]MCY4744815.1 phosphoethanolamine transferase [Pelomonas sp. UHG3]